MGGEMFTVLEGPVEDAGVFRVRMSCASDGKEGWVTTKGNAGTVYAEPSAKHYSVLREMPLQKGHPSRTSETVRQLEVGEALEVLEKPKPEQFAPEVRIKGKAVTDGATGWLTLSARTAKPWSASYKCRVATPIHDAALPDG